LDPYAQEFQALDGVEKGYGHILGCFFLVVVVVVVRSLNGGDTVEPANCPIIKCQISQALPNCVCFGVCVLVTRQKRVSQEPQQKIVRFSAGNPISLGCF